MSQVQNIDEKEIVVVTGRDLRFEINQVGYTYFLRNRGNSTITIDLGSVCVLKDEDIEKYKIDINDWNQDWEFVCEKVA